MEIEQKYQEDYSNELIIYKNQLSQQDCSVLEMSEIILKTRKLSSAESNPRLEDIMASDLLPIIFEKCENTHLSDQTRLDVLWLATNMASGNSKLTNYVVFQAKGLDFFLKYCSHANYQIVEQCFWGIGNIAGDNSELRDLIIDKGGIGILTSALESFPNVPSSVKKNFMWCLSNLCRGKPTPKFQQIIPLFPHFLKILKNATEQEDDTVIDCLWAFSYASDTLGKEYLFNQEMLFDLNIIAVVIPFLQIDKKAIQIPALKIIGNFASGEDRYIDEIISQGVLGIIIGLLNSQDKNIRKESAWLLSNIAAGQLNQVKSLTMTPGFYEAVNKILNNDDILVQKEALYIYFNLFFILPSSLMFQCLSQGCLKAMNKFLNDINPLPLVNDKGDKLFQKILDIYIEALHQVSNINNLTQDQYGVIKQDLIESSIIMKKIQKHKTHSQIEEIGQLAIKLKHIASFAENHLENQFQEMNLTQDNQGDNQSSIDEESQMDEQSQDSENAAAPY